MGVFFGRQARDGESKLQGYVEPRGSNRVPGVVRVNNETALRHSAVWACIRLRADLFSTLPVDVFRRVAKIQVEVPKPPVLLAPGGEHWDFVDWAWASSADLDKTGNTIGLITKKNGAGLPAEIELAPIDACRIIWRKGKPMSERRYRIDNKEYAASEVWHERQFPISGHPVGLSPVAYAAWTIAEYLNTQDFILNWFGNGGVPKARLKNKNRTIDTRESLKLKERYKATVQHGDIFIHGSDWEYDFMQSQSMGMEWLEAKRSSIPDVCRFFGAPADVIDAAVSTGGAITYANITERNLQLLIHHLGPMITRREGKFTSRLTPSSQYVKLNRQALLAMDPKTLAEVIERRIKSRTMTVNEGREKYDLPPLTQAQKDEFKELFGDPAKAPVDSSSKPGTDVTKGKSLDAVDRMLARGASL